MARTYRKREALDLCFRKPQTQNERIGLERILDEIEEEGYLPNNRVRTRGNKDSKIIPNAWDDLRVAAHSELDYADFILLSE